MTREMAHPDTTSSGRCGQKKNFRIETVLAFLILVAAVGLAHPAPAHAQGELEITLTQFIPESNGLDLSFSTPFFAICFFGITLR